MTKPTRNIPLLTLTILLGLITSGAQATQAPATQAPATPAAPTSPRTAEVILDDFARALAVGKSNRKPRSLRMTGKLTLKAMGLEGTMQSWFTADGKHRQTMQLPGLGTMASGFDGKRNWSQDPINGLRLLEGPEAEQARLDGAWMADLNLKKLYPKRRVVPPPAAAAQIKPADGGPGALECVELTPASAKLSPATMCFDPRTHLRVFHEGKQHTPQGVVPFSRVQSEWKEVEGWKIPHREEFTVGPASMTFTVEEIAWDQKFPAKTFKMPSPSEVAPGK